LFDLCGALGLGGCCVLCPREVIADSERFVDHLRQSDVAVWASTPSFVRQQMLNPRFTAAQLPSLRVFVFGAESLTPRVAEELWARFPQARIINSYGPTEATCSTTWVEIDAGLRAAAPNPFPIGVAKPYAEVFLDDGEICMAGDHVMRGYLDRPDLDQGVLFEHNGKRAYRSGDLGDLDAQGRVYFRGRKDDQIKLNGYRIELAEVDAALSTLEGVVAGAAVVLRRPDGSLVRPDLFIPLAEDTGLIEALTDQVMDNVIADMRDLLVQDRSAHIAINLAAEDVSSGRALKVLTQKLQGTGIHPQQIWLEATERGFIDIQRARNSLAATRRAGHCVAIDDFGVGYSSLHYLQQLPLDALKIDKSFIDAIGTDSATSPVTSHIIDMAKTLGLFTVAEGVEAPAQLAYLQSRQVEFGQGWLFSKPLPPEAFAAFHWQRKEQYGKARENMQNPNHSITD